MVASARPAAGRKARRRFANVPPRNLLQPATRGPSREFMSKRRPSTSSRGRQSRSRACVSASRRVATFGNANKKPGPARGPVSVCRCGDRQSSRGEHAAHRRFWEDTSGATAKLTMRSAPVCGNASGRMTAMPIRKSLPHSRIIRMTAMRNQQRAAAAFCRGEAIRNASAARWRPGNRGIPGCGRPL